MMRRAIEMSMRDFDEQTRTETTNNGDAEATPLNMDVDQVCLIFKLFTFVCIIKFFWLFAIHHLCRTKTRI